MNRIKVNLDKRNVRTHEIYIGRDILERAGLIVAKKKWADRYFIITDANVERLHGEAFREATASSLNTETLVVEPGEKSKSMETLLRLSRELLEKGADRQSGIIAFGGGVIGDLGGFLASIYMRGIPFVHVPTSLISQVDSAIGGKTGVDLPGAKNLLGTFAQPQAVFMDTSLLQTLPAEELSNGLAEIVKYGIIDDPEILEHLELNLGAVTSRDRRVLESLVERCCAIKKGIVEIDETEKGIRKVLNFGHTVGHAIEAESGYSVPHGAAVALGMLAAARISELLGYLREKDRSRIDKVIGALGLPCRLPDGISVQGVMLRLRNDKKKKDGKARFVLLKKIGMPFMNGGVPDEILEEIIGELKS